jgi:large subunit ribosomal protein L35
MPKIRTHKAAQHRFKITSSGKIMHTKVGKSHLRRKKPKRVKNQYAQAATIHPSNRARVKKLLPYS